MYTELEKMTIDGKEVLRISITQEGRRYIYDERLLDKPTNEAFADLIENHLCNGWEWVRPEEIGALTNAPILSDDIESQRNDKGEIAGSDFSVYWFPDYAVKSEVEELFLRGYVDFPKGE